VLNRSIRDKVVFDPLRVDTLLVETIARLFSDTAGYVVVSEQVIEIFDLALEGSRTR